MTQAPIDTYRTSVWALIAAIVLAALGVLLIYLAALLVVQGLAHGADSGGVREVMVGGGALVLVIGLLHILAAIRVWTHQISGRNLGLVFGLVGTALGVVILPSALIPPPGHAPELSGLIVVPYLVVLGGLIVGRGQFRRRSSESG